MKAKLFILALAGSLIINQFIYSQSDTIDYFGQEPPGEIPEKFSPGFISLDNRYEFNPMFSPDGNEFYFTISNPSSWTYSKTMASKYVNKIWTEPVEVNLGGSSLDWAHCFSPDGDTLYFNSNSDWMLDIYFVTRTATGWSGASKISNTINSIGSGIAYSISDSSTLFFRSTQSQQLGKGPKTEIFYSKKESTGYTSFSKMNVPVNSIYDENNPVIAKDESFLILTTARYSNANDICVSYSKDDGSWTNPKMLIENAESGSITPDNKYLLYYSTNNTSYTQTDIYWVKIENIIDSLRLTNYAPYVKSPLKDTILVKETMFAFQLSDSTFFDDDGDSTLTYSASSENDTILPDWLNFDPITKTFSGNTPNEGWYPIRLTVSDHAGDSATCTFTIVISHVPILLTPIGDTIVTANKRFIHRIKEDINFIDYDKLLYSATLEDGSPLPGWLEFTDFLNGEARLEGKPVAADTLSVKITATDTNDDSTSDIFQIIVQESPDKLEIVKSNDFYVFPNPATHTIQIKTDELISDFVGYEIVDLSGKLIKQGVLESEMLDVSDLNKGVYILSLKTDKQTISNKIVIE